MSERAKTHGGPAYPIDSYLVNGIMQAEGMTMRDRFALTALGGLLAAYKDCEWKPHQVAESAYAIADAVLKRKEETDPEPYDVSKEWTDA